ncbi:MAG: hypothetical protein ACOCV0_05935, partial [Alkalispirochaeta sp.]
MGKERSRKKSSFGVVFWIAAILLVLIIFLFNLPAIRAVLTTTGFVEVVFEERDQDTPEDSVGPEDTGSEESVPLPAPDETEVDPDTPESPGATENESGDPTVSDEPDDPVVDADEEDPQEIVVEPPADPETESTERTRSVTLFFIRVTDDGRIVASSEDRAFLADQSFISAGEVIPCDARSGSYERFSGRRRHLVSYARTGALDWLVLSDR